MPATTKTEAPLELRLSRDLDAPRQLVYDVWTRPEHLKHWQGAPKGMTVSNVLSDLRPGGRFKLCMTGGDGVEHWLQGEYREVAPPERLVFTHCWLDQSGQPGPETLVTVTFEPVGSGTRLTLVQSGFSSAGSREGHRGGWTSTLDRLEEYLVTGLTERWES